MLSAWFSFGIRAPTEGKECPIGLQRRNDHDAVSLRIINGSHQGATSAHADRAMSNSKSSLRLSPAARWCSFWRVALALCACSRVSRASACPSPPSEVPCWATMVRRGQGRRREGKPIPAQTQFSCEMLRWLRHGLTSVPSAEPASNDLAVPVVWAAGSDRRCDC